MRVLDLRDIRPAAGVKRGGRQDQDRGVHEQRQAERHRAVDRRPHDRVALPFARAVVIAGLHGRGMEVEIVGHDGRPQNSDRNIEHRRVGHHFRARHET